MKYQNIIKMASIVGARPNFIKVAPVSLAIAEYNKDNNKVIKEIIIHTSQHYDDNISKVFFRELHIPKPHYNLGVGSGSHGWQTGEMLKRVEKVLVKEKPNIVLVYGDTNSTLAGALAAVKLLIPVAHVEAGLRSFDREMPEETNRILTDDISDYLFITEYNAYKNLLQEGIPKENMFLVGNVMIDTLLNNKEKANNYKILEELKLKPKEYGILTLHRPSNVNRRENLNKILEAINDIQKYIKIVYPIHPRTKRKLIEFDFADQIKRIKDFKVIEPLGYLQFLKMMMEAKLIMTDSGGIQEETTVLGIPCLTLRENTERPVTVEKGTNVLVGRNKERIIAETFKILHGERKAGKIPKFWDGKAAQRIVKILMQRL